MHKALGIGAPVLGKDIFDESCLYSFKYVAHHFTPFDLLFNQFVGIQCAYSILPYPLPGSWWITDCFSQEV